MRSNSPRNSVKPNVSLPPLVCWQAWISTLPLAPGTERGFPFVSNLTFVKSWLTSAEDKE